MHDVARALHDLLTATAGVIDALDRQYRDLARRLDELERPPKVYTVAEAAKVLRVSERTVYRLIDDGKLPTLPISDDRRVTRIPAWAVEGRAA